MRATVVLLPLLLSGCLSFDLIVDGDAVAEGGRAVLRAEVLDRNCYAVVGDCIDEVEVTEASVQNEDVAGIVSGDGGLEIEGLALGTARVVADLAWQDRLVRQRLDVPVVEVTGIWALRGEQSLDADSILTLAPGGQLAVETVLGSDQGEVQGEGLHTLQNDDGLLVLDEDGGSQHVLVAGSTEGRAVVTAELDGATLFQVEITATR